LVNPFYLKKNIDVQGDVGQEREQIEWCHFVRQTFKMLALSLRAGGEFIRQLVTKNLCCYLCFQGYKLVSPLAYFPSF
jgi:hypothetical protein